MRTMTHAFKLAIDYEESFIDANTPQLGEGTKDMARARKKSRELIQRIQALYLKITNQKIKEIIP
jgi:hypothetical protein